MNNSALSHLGTSRRVATLNEAIYRVRQLYPGAVASYDAWGHTFSLPPGYASFEETVVGRAVPETATGPGPFLLRIRWPQPGDKLFWVYDRSVWEKTVEVVIASLGTRYVTLCEKPDWRAGPTYHRDSLRSVSGGGHLFWSRTDWGARAEVERVNAQRFAEWNEFRRLVQRYDAGPPKFLDLDSLRKLDRDLREIAIQN